MGEVTIRAHGWAKLGSESVGLIYLDPPLNSNRNYLREIA